MGPRIERATANELAELSDEVAEQLENGDQCAAAASAARLRDGVTQAINAGEVPEIYLEDLSGLTNEIEAQLPQCVEQAPPPDDGADEDDDDGGGRGKGKKDKKKGDDDEKEDD